MLQAFPEKTPERVLILRVSEVSPSISSYLSKEILLPNNRDQNDRLGVFSGLADCNYIEKDHFTQQVIDYNQLRSI